MIRFRLKKLNDSQDVLFCSSWDSKLFLMCVVLKENNIIFSVIVKI